MNLVSLLVLTLAITSTGAASAQRSREASSSAPLERQLERESEELNKLLPRVVNKFSRLDSVFAGPGLVMTHFYTLLSPEDQRAKQPDIERALGRQLRVGLCKTETSLRDLRRGITLTYVYRAIDGNVLGIIRVNRKDCEGGT